MKVAVLGSSLFARTAAAQLSRAGNDVVRFGGAGEKLRRLAGCFPRLRAALPEARFEPIPFLSRLPFRDRVALAKLPALGRIASPTFASASDYETVDQWLDRLYQSPAARRNFWAPLVQQIAHGGLHNSSAKMIEVVAKPALLARTDNESLAIPLDDLDELSPSPSPSIGRACAASIDVEELRLGALTLESGEMIRFDLIVSALSAEGLLKLLPRTVGETEPYFRALGRLSDTRPHAPGCEAFRPRVQSPIEGLLVIGPHVRTGLPMNAESAMRSIEEIAPLAARVGESKAAAVASPPHTPGFVPLGRLKPVTPANSNP